MRLLRGARPHKIRPPNHAGSCSPRAGPGHSVRARWMFSRACWARSSSRGQLGSAGSLRFLTPLSSRVVAQPEGPCSSPPADLTDSGQGQGIQRRQLPHGSSPRGHWEDSTGSWGRWAPLGQQIWVSPVQPAHLRTRRRLRPTSTGLPVPEQHPEVEGPGSVFFSL